MKKKKILHEMCLRSRMLGEARMQYRLNKANYPRGSKFVESSCNYLKHCEQQMREIEEKAVKKGLIKSVGTLMQYSEWA
jgi:hypothetical protein